VIYICGVCCQTVEVMLLIQYSGGAGLQAGYCRQCSVSLSIDIMPSVLIRDHTVTYADRYVQFILRSIMVTNLNQYINHIRGVHYVIRYFFHQHRHHQNVYYAEVWHDVQSLSFFIFCTNSTFELLCLECLPDR